MVVSLAMRHTEVDFDDLSWHDCSIWGIELRPGDPDVGDWTSDLSFDIDFIVEWVCASPVADGKVQFRVAPATLVFHGASDLTIAVPVRGRLLSSSISPKYSPGVSSASTR